MKFLQWVLVLLLCVACSDQKETNDNQKVLSNEIRISFDPFDAKQAWGAERLRRGVEYINGSFSHVSIDANIKVSIGEFDLGAEAYQIRRDAQSIIIEANDSVGAMYGISDVAEQLEIAKNLDAVIEKNVSPRFPLRAIKFNLPWSSYRKGEALQLHTETVRDIKFWEAYLDMMAENRFNAITLWNLHPWPYLIKPTNFPKASPFNDTELKEWQDFWHALFKMAQDRGIKPYLVTWNINVNEEFRVNYEPSAATDQGVWGEGYSSEIVQRYNRESVTQVINEYPNLAGLGTSAGDKMGDMTPQEAQDWINDVYYGGMKAANRHVEFIHRAAFRGTDADVISRKTIEEADIDKPIYAELKFNWSHALSSPKLHQIHNDNAYQEANKYFNPVPTDYKIAWMIRNEDIFVLRWGQSSFIREHIALNGHDFVGGYVYGSETYIPAKDYIHQPRHPHVNWAYEFERKWLQYMEWGRLLYDPTTPNSVFANAAEKKFGTETGEKLIKAWDAASIASLRFGQYAPSTWDFTLFEEGFMSGLDENDQGTFFSMDMLINANSLDSDYLNVRDWVAAGSPDVHDKITPLELAFELEQKSAEALSLLNSFPIGTEALNCEKVDIEVWVNYGNYFANKLRGAVAKVQGNPEKSRDYMQSALMNWQEIIRLNETHNHSAIPDMQNGIFSWRNQLEAVRAEAQ